MKLQRSGFLCRGLLALVLAGVAGNSIAENLLEVLSLAQEHDARWAAARAAHQAGQEKTVQGAAALLPTLGIKGGYDFSRADVEYRSPSLFPDGVHYYENGEYGLVLSHPLYRRQNYALYQQSVSQTALSNEQFRYARTDLIQRVAQAYFEVLTAQDNLALAEAEIAALSEQLKQAEARLSAGVAGITDLLDTQARHDLAKAREIAARNELVVKQQALRRITFRHVTLLSSLKPGVELPQPEQDDMNYWIDISYQNSPVLRAQEHVRQSAEWEVYRANGEHFPTLDLVANFTRSHSTGSIYTRAESLNEIRNIGVQMQIPLFQGGGTRSRVREAVANKEKTKHEQDDARREVENQTRLIFIALINGRSQIQALEQAQQSGEKLLEASTLGREAGIRTWVDVLNAQQQLFTTRRDLSRTRYEYLQNLLKLKAVAGVLEEKDLEQINGLLGVPASELESGRASGPSH